jgi:hypothetical protein
MTGWGAVRGRYRVAADPLRTERKVELAAVMLALVLCLQLLYSGARLAMAPVFDAVVPAADALRVKRVDSPAAVATSQSDEIRARPLFWQARRPIQESSVEVAPNKGGEQAGQVKDVKLLGVFGSGDMAGIIALVKGKKRRILQGESIEGWTLEVVEPNRVVLVDGGRREELVLKTGIVIAAADHKKTVTKKGGSSAAPAAKRSERRLSTGGAARGGAQ